MVTEPGVRPPRPRVSPAMSCRRSPHRGGWRPGLPLAPSPPAAPSRPRERRCAGGDAAGCARPDLMRSQHRLRITTGQIPSWTQGWWVGGSRPPRGAWCPTPPSRSGSSTSLSGAMAPQPGALPTCTGSTGLLPGCASSSSMLPTSPPPFSAMAGGISLAAASASPWPAPGSSGGPGGSEKGSVPEPSMGEGWVAV